MLSKFLSFIVFVSKNAPKKGSWKNVTLLKNRHGTACAVYVQYILYVAYCEDSLLYVHHHQPTIYTINVMNDCLENLSDNAFGILERANVKLRADLVVAGTIRAL